MRPSAASTLEHGKQIGRGADAGDVEWLAAAGERVAQRSERRPSTGWPCDSFVQSTYVEAGDEIGAAIRVLFPERDQLRGIAVGQGVEQDRFDDAEDSGVCADAEHEREDRDGGESGLPFQRAARVSNVSKQAAHAPQLSARMCERVKTGESVADPSVVDVRWPMSERGGYGGRKRRHDEPSRSVDARNATAGRVRVRQL